ncbi:MAG: response regulator transcription factor [Anaerolineae bacterium]|nr:response regulator transcription factor [Anaerolineae bacterium]
MTIRLLITDDHAVVRSGLHMILENEADFQVVAEAETARQAVDLACAMQPDVVLMDIGLPDMSGIQATKQIIEKCANTRVVALTIHEDEEYFFKMLDAGASGYVPKRAAPEELISAIRAAAAGEVYIYPSLAKLLVKDFLAQLPAKGSRPLDGLTPRESQVLALLAEGDSNTEIAQELNISPKTVARHRENIMYKLNLHTRTELVKYAIRKGIIEP